MSSVKSFAAIFADKEVGLTYTIPLNSIIAVNKFTSS